MVLLLACHEWIGSATFHVVQTTNRPRGNWLRWSARV